LILRTQATSAPLYNSHDRDLCARASSDYQSPCDASPPCVLPLPPPLPTLMFINTRSDPHYQKVSFEDVKDRMDARFVKLINWNGEFDLHPFFNFPTYQARRASASPRLYTFNSSATLYEPAVDQFLQQQYPALHESVSQLHRPPITMLALRDNLLKWSSKPPTVDWNDPAWRFAKDRLNEVFSRSLSGEKTSSLEEMAPYIKNSAPGYPSCLSHSTKKEAFNALTLPILRQFAIHKSQGKIPQAYVTYDRDQPQG